MASPPARYRLGLLSERQLTKFQPPVTERDHPLAVLVFMAFFSAFTVWFAGGWLIKELI